MLPLHAHLIMGASYPADLRIETQIRAICPVPSSPYATLIDRHLGTHSNHHRKRAEALAASIAEKQETSALVIGRSSGAIVASQLAAISPDLIAGVICFGYPFRNPKQPDEPFRYKHLDGLATPVLILQGMHDAYGGAEWRDRCAGARDLTFVTLDTNHEFRGPDRLWEDIRLAVTAFVERLEQLRAARRCVPPSSA